MNPASFQAVAKLGGVLGLAGAIGVGAYNAGHRHATDAARGELQAARADRAAAAAEHAALVAQINANAVKVEADASRRIADARQSAQRHAVAVKELIRETTEFAAVVRPADLQRVRDEQLDAIAAAAARTADLSGRGVPAVRSADQGRAHDGGN